MNTFIVEFLDPETYQQKEGVLVSQHYEPVSDRWALLIAGRDGRMYSVYHTSVGANINWVGSDSLVVLEDDDDDADDDDGVYYE